MTASPPAVTAAAPFELEAPAVPPAAGTPAAGTPAAGTPAAGTPDEAAELGAWVGDQLRRRGGSAATVALTVPAPTVEPEALLEIAGGASPGPDLAFFWHPPEGAAVAGLGATHRLELKGRQRFDSLRQGAAELWRGLEAISHPASEAPTPRLYGGLAFDVGAADNEPWTEFGDGCFTLPRLLYSDGGGGSLTLTVGGEEIRHRAGRQAVAAELEAILAALAATADRATADRATADRATADRATADRATADRDWRSRAAASPRVLAIEPPARRPFAAQVEAIRAAIAGGAVEKIVLAGRSRARLAAAPETGAILRRLRRGLLASTRFAFCRRRGTFLGATPEWLVSRRGRVIATEALAGSLASGADARQLLESGKDLREHQLVIDAIVRRLESLTERLEVAPRPRIRELREVLHLHTPISGLLAAPRHVLELVEQLHPTPAVGGVPTAAARRWIRRHEGDPRGWYAAPVGWFDAAGDGEFAVALRSSLLSGGGLDGAEAFIYAGAGIVRDSDPELEYTETELKKQALLLALGA